MKKYIHTTLVFGALFSCIGHLTGVGIDKVSCGLDSVSKYACSVNDFSANLTTTLDGNGNLFISPLSISLALIMVYAGAKETTASQMKDALQLKKYGINRKELDKAAKTLIEGYQKANDQYDLKLANIEFVQEGYKIKDAYLSKVKDNYQAKIENVDFVKNGAAVMEEINNWVSNATNKMIDKLLAKPLDPSTIMAILNAIYFKGTWETKFDKENTKDGDFAGPNGNKKVKLMKLSSVSFPYFEDNDYQFLQMPYKGDDIVMLFALPKRKEDFPDFQMTASELSRITSSMWKTELEKVVIPKFHMEYDKTLNDALTKLGMHDIFTSRANLGGISKKNDLFVSSVVHRAVVDVYEEGSKAAAVTGVFVVRMAAAFEPRPKPEFIADHSFAFYIVDKQNGLIIFNGRVTEPGRE